MKSASPYRPVSYKNLIAMLLASRKFTGATQAGTKLIDRFFAALVGTDSNHLFDSGNEDLAVTDLSGLGRL